MHCPRPFCVDFYFSRSNTRTGACFDIVVACHRLPLPTERSTRRLSPPCALSNMPSSPQRNEQPNPDTMHASTSSTSSLMRGRTKRNYFHGGIGGAGNYHHVVGDNGADRGPYPHTAPRQSQLSRSITALFSSGAGGAGNMRQGSEELALREREEEDHARARVRASQYPSRGFVGIGGLGNWRGCRLKSPSSDMSLSSNSEYSTQPLPLGAADAIKRKLLGEKSAKTTNDNRR
jgi:hypothetical protein